MPTHSKDDLDCIREGIAIETHARLFEAILIKMSPLYFTEHISAEHLIKSADKLSNLAAKHLCPA